MNKLSLAFLFLLAICSVNSYCQLSDRVNSPSTFKVGTRPVMGNYGLFFGLAYNELEYWFDNDIKYNGLPIVSIKYYKTDNNVWRIGFQTSTTNEILKGTVDPTVNGTILEEKKLIDKVSRFTLYPGFEHHFTGSNVLDVYIGGLVPIGWNKDKFTDDETYNNNGYTKYTRTRTSLTYGLEAYAGIQAFVADLPLALGVDFGAAALGHLSNKYKHEISTKVGVISTDQVYYTVDDTGAGTKYESLKQRDYQLQGNVRLTITYFFKK